MSSPFELLKRATPIVGQPFAITAWSITVLLTCKCDSVNPHPMLVSNGRFTQCPKCRKVYQLQGARVTPGQTAQFDVVCVPPENREPEKPALIS